jgi:hypothetical protein
MIATAAQATIAIGTILSSRENDDAGSVARQGRAKAVTDAKVDSATKKRPSLFMMYNRSFLISGIFAGICFNYKSRQYYPYFINFIIALLFKKCNSFLDKKSQNFEFF